MFVKLFNSILKSSVWDERPTTRIVWITFLLEADEQGFVKGVERGLARVANVSVEEFRAALEILEADDIESQDQDFGGRRIEKVEGGWQVLNYRKYRELRTGQQVREAAKKRRQRAQRKATDAGKSLPDNAPANAAAAAAEGVPGHVPAVPTIASASASVSGGRGAGEGVSAGLMSPREFLDAVAEAEAAKTPAPIEHITASWTEEHVAAYYALRKKHRNHAGLASLLLHAHATGFSSAVLGQALVEIWQAGAPLSKATLEPFARRIQQRTGGHGLTPPSLSAARKGWCSACVGTAETGHRRGCPFGVADALSLPPREPSPRLAEVRA